MEIEPAGFVLTNNTGTKSQPVPRPQHQPLLLKPLPQRQTNQNEL